jgi:hypothetical protein
MDLHLAYVLRSLGYAVASHVMARASLSRTGSNEVTLTADLGDQFWFMRNANEYLDAVGSKSRIQLDVFDLSGPGEVITGADVVFLFTGRVNDGKGGSRPVSKVALAQAKRMDYRTQNAYMTGGDYISQVNKMEQALGGPGATGAYFLFYHSRSVLGRHPAPTWSPAPSFRFFPPHYKQQTYQRSFGAFGETSIYRRRAMSGGIQHLRGFERGAMLVSTTKLTRSPDLPQPAKSISLPHVPSVLKSGIPLHELLVDVVSCREGATVSTDGFRAIASSLRGFQPSADARGDGQRLVRAVAIQFGSVDDADFLSSNALSQELDLPSDGQMDPEFGE